MSLAGIDNSRTPLGFSCTCSDLAFAFGGRFIELRDSVTTPVDDINRKDVAIEQGGLEAKRLANLYYSCCLGRNQLNTQGPRYYKGGCMEKPESVKRSWDWKFETV